MMRDRNLAFADEPQGDQLQDCRICVLIGSVHCWMVTTGRVGRSCHNLCAVETKFGWVIQGMCAKVHQPSSQPNVTATAFFLASSNDRRTEDRPGGTSEMWLFSAIVITDGQQDDVSRHPALIHFRNAVHKSAGYHVVLLMIKTPRLTSCTNRTVAETTLKRQLQWFEHNPEVLQEYQPTISDHFREGYTERIVPSALIGQTV
ncbi:hypothetical protein MTO96_012511 [Rhipicephalus appendiculatus]